MILVKHHIGDFVERIKQVYGDNTDNRNFNFCVLTSGCTSVNELVKNIGNNSGNSTFSAYGVNFNYPSGWMAVADNQTRSNSISVINDSSFNGVQFNLQIMNNNGLSEKGVIKQLENTKTPGWKKISHSTLTIDGKKAYKDVFIYKNGDSTQNMRFEQVYFVKNGKTYIMLIQAPDNDFENERSNFNTILNSLKVQ